MPDSWAVMVSRAEETRRLWPDWISRKIAEGTGLGPLRGGRSWPGMEMGRVLGKERRSMRRIGRVTVLGRGKRTEPGRKRTRLARLTRGSVYGANAGRLAACRTARDARTSAGLGSGRMVGMVHRACSSPSTPTTSDAWPSLELVPVPVPSLSNNQIPTMKFPRSRLLGLAGSSSVRLMS